MSSLNIFFTIKLTEKASVNIIVIHSEFSALVEVVTLLYCHISWSFGSCCPEISYLQEPDIGKEEEDYTAIHLHNSHDRGDRGSPRGG